MPSPTGGEGDATGVSAFLPLPKGRADVKCYSAAFARGCGLYCTAGCGASRRARPAPNSFSRSEPSPQRTPVLYQAGTSPRGRQFAAEHAECVFMSGPSAKVIAPRVAAIRELAAKGGRNTAEILMFSMFTVILGRTEAEAKAKYADYRSHINPEGALTLMSGWTGVDFSTYDLDQQVRHVENDAGRSAMDNVTRAGSIPAPACRRCPRSRRARPRTAC